MATPDARPVREPPADVLVSDNEICVIVALPVRNRCDPEEIPESVRNTLQFVRVERVEEALEHALEQATPQRAAA